MDEEEQRSESELLSVVSEALSLANTACSFDSTGNFTAACDYYDMYVNSFPNIFTFSSPETLSTLNQHHNSEF
jgi:hypothetical protein